MDPSAGGRGAALLTGVVSTLAAPGRRRCDRTCDPRFWGLPVRCDGVERSRDLARGLHVAHVGDTLPFLAYSWGRVRRFERCDVSRGERASRSATRWGSCPGDPKPPCAAISVAGRRILAYDHEPGDTDRVSPRVQSYHYHARQTDLVEPEPCGVVCDSSVETGAIESPVENPVVRSHGCSQPVDGHAS